MSVSLQCDVTFFDKLIENRQKISFNKTICSRYNVMLRIEYIQFICVFYRPFYLDSFTYASMEFLGAYILSRRIRQPSEEENMCYKL